MSRYIIELVNPTDDPLQIEHKEEEKKGGKGKGKGKGKQVQESPMSHLSKVSQEFHNYFNALLTIKG